MVRLEGKPQRAARLDGAGGGWNTDVLPYGSDGHDDSREEGDSGTAADT